MRVILRVVFSVMATFFMFVAFVWATFVHYSGAETLAARVGDSTDVLVTSAVLGMLAMVLIRVGFERRVLSLWLLVGLVPAAAQVLASATPLF